MWAAYLSALLKGRALDVYDRLSTEDAANYDKFKEALLKHFDMTERRFRSLSFTTEKRTFNINNRQRILLRSLIYQSNIRFLSYQLIIENQATFNRTTYTPCVTKN